MGCLQPVWDAWLLSNKFSSKALPTVENVESYSYKGVT